VSVVGLADDLATSCCAQCFYCGHHRINLRSLLNRATCSTKLVCVGTIPCSAQGFVALGLTVTGLVIASEGGSASRDLFFFGFSMSMMMGILFFDTNSRATFTKTAARYSSHDSCSLCALAFTLQNPSFTVSDKCLTETRRA